MEKAGACVQILCECQTELIAGGMVNNYVYHGMTSLTFDMGRPIWRFRWCISTLMVPV